MPSLESIRHQALREFIAAGHVLEIGSPDACPLPVHVLARIHSGDVHVIETHRGGLTAMVYRIRVAGHEYALKVQRQHALVKNFDGETSFLNELLRRTDIEQLKTRGAWPAQAAVTPTIYASSRHGILLTPWIDGGHVENWNSRCLAQVLDAAAALVEAGFFEWDFSPGNILDDGKQIWLFDLGYCYRFDPLTQFNTAGNGTDKPLFHAVERL
jgi:predicted Ser/Thr protein kinase